MIYSLGTLNTFCAMVLYRQKFRRQKVSKKSLGDENFYGHNFQPQNFFANDHFLSNVLYYFEHFSLKTECAIAKFCWVKVPFTTNKTQTETKGNTLPRLIVGDSPLLFFCQKNHPFPFISTPPVQQFHSKYLPPLTNNTLPV